MILAKAEKRNKSSGWITSGNWINWLHQDHEGFLQSLQEAELWALRDGLQLASSQRATCSTQSGKCMDALAVVQLIMGLDQPRLINSKVILYMIADS